MPVYSARQVTAALAKVGFLEVSRRGSHVKLRPGQRMWGLWGPEGMFVTHGAKKPKPRQLARELQRAREIFHERRAAG
jgi:hypothetical protein